MYMNLKPQDIFVALKLVAMASPRWTYVQLANELFMSASEINASIKRGIKARLIADVDREMSMKTVSTNMIYCIQSNNTRIFFLHDHL